MAPAKLSTGRPVALLIALAAIGIVIALGWCSGRPERTSPLHPLETAAKETTSESDLRRPSGEPKTPEGHAARTDLTAEPVPVQAAPAETEPTIDRDAKGKLSVRVVDRLGAPIVQASVSARGWRTTLHPGDWYSWEGPEVDLLTNREGIAIIEHALWSAHGGDWFDVAIVCFAVAHPEYVSQDLEVKVAAEAETTVTLLHGSFLIVSGWIGSPEQRIAAVVPHVSADVEVAAADWIPLADGRPSCSRIPPGEHALYITVDREGATWASAVVEFALAEEEQKELHLELLAPSSLAGMLDPEVPRPVVAGEVELNLYYGARETRAVFLRKFREPVAADGSFHFANLPPGTGEMIGMCAGWSSLRLPPVPEEGAEVQQVLQDWDLRLQQVPAAFFVDGSAPFVLRMERAARVEVTVLDPAGEPLEGAHITMWPNVHWTIGWSGIFLDRQWTASTDRRGLAVIENVPPGSGMGLNIALAGYRMPLADSYGQARRQASVDLVSGATAKIAVRLERDE